MSTAPNLSVSNLVSRETEQGLRAYIARMEQWSKALNISGRSTLENAWSRHILDSLQLVELADWPSNWLDIGSGAGFPGGPLAFVASERGGQVDLVESNRKKAAFLQLALDGLPAKVHARRIEAVTLNRTPAYVTARAFAPLPQLLSAASRWLTDGATGLFHKGRDFQRELDSATDQWRFDLVIHQSKISDDSVILQVRNLRSVAGS